MTTATLDEPPTETHVPLIDQLEDLAKADTNVLLHKLSERALLVDLTVRQWEGRHQIEGAEITMGGKSLPKELTSKSHWILRPKDWSERFNQMANILRNFMHPKVQPKRGIDIIALKDAPKIFAAVKKYREETYEPTVEEFVLAWPAIAAKLHPDLVTHFSASKVLSPEEAKKAADDVYKQLAKHVPTQEALKGKFGVFLEVFPLGDSLNAVRSGLQGEHAEEFISDMEKATRNFAQQVFLEIMEQPLQEAAEVAQSIADKAANGKGGLREESIGVMKRALEKIKSFSDFIARPALLQAVATAEEKLRDYNHEELNEALRKKTIVGKALGDVFKSIGDEVSQAQAVVSKFGRKFRQIEL